MDYLEKRTERHASVIWRNMLLMLLVLVLSVVGLIISHNMSLRTMKEEKWLELRAALERDAEKLGTDMYTTSSIPKAITSTRYYSYIQGDRNGVLAYEHYPVLNYISQAISDQIYLRGISDECLLYFPGCNSIAGRTVACPTAEDCFAEEILFPETDTAVLIGYLSSKDVQRILPMQPVTMGGVTQPMLGVILRPSGSTVGSMSLYREDVILDSLGGNFLPENTYLQIEAEDGQILMTWPQPLSQKEKDARIRITASMTPIRANVSIWVEDQAMEQLLQPAANAGMFIIALVLVLGLIMSFVLSKISVEPLRKLVSSHAGTEHRSSNEIQSLDRILNRSKEREQGLQNALVSSILAKVFFGIIPDQTDEALLREKALPEGTEYRTAVVTGTEKPQTLFCRDLATQLPEAVWVRISPTQLGVVFPARDEAVGVLTTLTDNLNNHHLSAEDGLCCGISAPFLELSNLITAIRQARFSCPGEPGVVVFRGQRIRSHIYSRLQHERLYQSIFADDREGAQRVLESIGQQLELGSVREIFYNVRFTLRSAAEEMELDMEPYDQEYMPNKSPEANLKVLMEMLDSIFLHMKKKSKGDVTALQERVMTWLRENAFDPNICATTVAREFRITEKRAYEIVRNTTGMSFSEYLLMLRMKAAGRLLYATQLSVAEVAHQCGYPAESTFYRVFRKYHGISPSQYRKNGVLEES